MNVQIEESWKAHLEPEFDKDYFRTLTDFVKSEYSQYQIFPPGKLIFNAFNLCPFDKVKVVIIGQDPYHGPGQAHGLCFSVNDGVPFPPSLVNIFKEIKADIGVDAPTTGNLTRWAEQGVLLLNRRSHPHIGRRKRKPGIYPVGIIRSKERSIYRPQQTSGTYFRPSFSPFCLQWFLRQQTLQPCKRLSESTRRNGNCLVILK